MGQNTKFGHFRGDGPPDVVVDPAGNSGSSIKPTFEGVPYPVGFVVREDIAFFAVLVENRVHCWGEGESVPLPAFHDGTRPDDRVFLNEICF